ncbi:cob(I)yrinic acid a,c-diamide adenosyltransferase [Syntrophus aciditrophicus]|uniref:corrinoid adenosyltransferase n=1 Tax=Syntrophus aciditrophicus (strain SB) TaxID=56780 RepID=Q2LX61_SYNAS|nr:cob(I)yrinic acid a,c-diamide adenosyltransferase [Syntrophus aciditrophicus]ABC78668.1 cob(I)alamin adenosyltransferase [Syntrophus aciditrophicus SB]OPY16837.1 MAG: Cob(I)yrinic acid a,c-diamide adenosyltransferase [Syntrophus sp. PtaB.Bin075]
MTSQKRRILLFTGEGKGKTTAALGMALRACGHGMRVRIIQFIKADPTTGEAAAVSHLPGVELIQTGLGFVPPESSAEYSRHRQAAERGLLLAEEAVLSDQYDLIVLDEICNAIALHLLTEEKVISVVRQAGSCRTIVLTGRDAPESLLSLADTVTIMTCFKHAMTAGRPSEKGVEY